MKVYCKKSYKIVAGELLFTKGKWYKVIYHELGEWDIAGNRIECFGIPEFFDSTKNMIIDELTFYKGYGYFGLNEYFHTKQQYNRIQKLQKLKELCQ